MAPAKVLKPDQQLLIVKYYNNICIVGITKYLAPKLQRHVCI